MLQSMGMLLSRGPAGETGWKKRTAYTRIPSHEAVVWYLKTKTSLFHPAAIPSIAISLLILRRLTYRRLILPGSSATSSAATHRRLICLSIRVPAVPALVCSSCLRTLRLLIVHRHTSLIDLLHLLLYIRPIFDVLLELANVAVHCVPGLQAKWYDRNETEGKPFPSWSC